ncbi:MAG: 3-oxoacyl-ACP reductase [Gammaproteobacteria bacterium]|nr:3-oxoacyl-ACP reductase [Gammaproteobacteria bacterium]
MADRYLQFVNTAVGRAVSGALGLPQPPRLVRDTAPYAAQPLAGQTVTLAAAAASRLCAALLRALDQAGARVAIEAALPGLPAIKAGAQAAGVALHGEPAPGEGTAAAALVFDASGLERPQDLRALYDFFHPRLRRLPANARVLVIGAGAGGPPARAATQAALGGFVRSLAKEIGRNGSIANLLDVGAGAEDWLAGPLRFLLTPRSAFVSAQTLPLAPAQGAPPQRFEAMLAGKRALVTGAARGIGAAIAAALAREGAKVIGVDRPQEEAQLGRTLAAIDGLGIAADITAEQAPGRIAAEAARLGGIDVLVHNAGVTRDKLLRNMPEHWWEQVIAVNLAAIPRLTDALLAEGLNPAARIVCISSIGGIAGNLGQTNYAATKAGVLGYVCALAPTLAQQGGAINAVAPGFIETAMTAAMPVLPREIGRRLSSLSQAGLPEDVAEAVLFLSGTAAGAVNGCTLRVCGQNLAGA